MSIKSRALSSQNRCLESIFLFGGPYRTARTTGRSRTECVLQLPSFPKERKKNVNRKHAEKPDETIMQQPFNYSSQGRGEKGERLKQARTKSSREMKMTDTTWDGGSCWQWCQEIFLASPFLFTPCVEYPTRSTCLHEAKSVGFSSALKGKWKVGLKWWILTFCIVLKRSPVSYSFAKESRSNLIHDVNSTIWQETFSVPPILLHGFSTPYSGLKLYGTTPRSMLLEFRSLHFGN